MRFLPSALFALVLAVSSFTAMDAHAFFGGPGKQVPVDINKNGNYYGYYEYLPLDYSETSGKKFPVVFFFHGLGETGDGKAAGGLPRVLRNGPPKFLSNGSKHLPAIVISPQADVGFWYLHVNKMIDYVLKTYPAADPDRIYITGLSMGGGQVFDFLNSNLYARVAAAVPICTNWTENDVTNASQLTKMPIWFFHSYDDRTAYYMNSVNILQKITPAADNMLDGYLKNGKDAIVLYSNATGAHTWTMGSNTSKTINADTTLRMTLYATGGHDAWSRAYLNDDMWNWLFSFKKGGVLIGSGTTTPPVVTPPVVTPPVVTPPVVTPPVVTPPVVTPPAPTTGTVKIDFGSGTAALNSEWNNAGASIKSNSIALKDATGAASGINLVTVSSRKNVNPGGTTAPVAALNMPVGATQDSIFGSSLAGAAGEPKITYELTGLNPAKSYTFQFFASRDRVSDNRTAKYTVTGASSVNTSLNASNNKSVVATTAAVKPGADGKLRVEIEKGVGNNEPSGYFYLSNIVIKY